MNITRQDRNAAPGLHTQHGAILIVSMLILLVLTIIGVSSMQSSTLEEKMASNSRDRNIGFQSAESTIREAETYIEDLVTTGGFTDANGLYSAIENEPDPYAAATWTATGTSRTATPPGGSAGAQYFITRTGTIVDQSAGGGVELPPTAREDISVFRITARGRGATTEGAEVMLRSYYGRQM